MSPRHTARSQCPADAWSAASSAVAFACTSLRTSKRMERPPKRQRRSRDYKLGQSAARTRGGSLIEVEDDGDVDVNWNRLAIQMSRLIFPLAQRIDGGCLQQRIAADHF